jgi:hypothetical protein
MAQSNDKLIPTRRAELGMTQADAASKAGVSLATWRRFEQSPSLGYRSDTIRGVLRALRLSQEDLASLLDGSGPAPIDRRSRGGWEAKWNELWNSSNWPSITPRMAAAIQAALDMARDMLQSSVGDNNFDPEDCPVLEQFDPRIFISVGNNPAWFRAATRRLDHLVKSMGKGLLIDESCECFADVALFAAAVRDAAAMWGDNEDMGVWANLNDKLRPESGENLGGSDQGGPNIADAQSDRWEEFEDDLDDRVPYREWDCVFAEYRKTRLLLDRRPVETWFDEPDAELDAFRAAAPYNLLAQELVSPKPGDGCTEDR